MNRKIDEFKNIEKTELIPFEEIVALDLNLSGVVANVPYKRVRFNLRLNEKHSLLFSLENNNQSLYSIQQNKLYFNDIFLFNIDGLIEDTCEVFYTRKNGRVLCFNPNNRSACKGCRFCYQPKSSDNRIILPSMLLGEFEEWMKKNSLTDLSHLEQVAVVTGCFNSEQVVVDYLIKLRKILSELEFNGEILYFGIISNIENLILLSKIKPLQICFTIECFENRKYMLQKKKNLDINFLREIMKKSLELGIATTFSYIVGLDSLISIQKKMFFLKDAINVFPIISVFQTDDVRIRYRHFEANNIYYYLNSRKSIEDIFSDTILIPNSWNNYRSLWRTCYGKKNRSIIYMK